MVRVRAKAEGSGIALALAARRVVLSCRARRAFRQRVGFELGVPQQYLQFIGSQGHHVTGGPVRDLHLDRGDTGLQMRDAFRCKIPLKLRRPRVQVVAVAGWEFEQHGLVGRDMIGSAWRHDNSLAFWFTVLLHARVPTGYRCTLPSHRMPASVRTSFSATPECRAKNRRAVELRKLKP
jgi:hypothetical protein